MRRHGYWWILLIGLLFGLGGQQVEAASNDYVNDDAAVLTTKTKQMIKRLNTTTLKKLPGGPSLVVETYRELPSSDDEMASFKTERFNDLQIGDRDWDNGVLFVLVTDAREYGLEVGYGLEAALPDASKNKIVTKAATADLKAERYDAAVQKISTNIVQTLKANREAIASKQAVAAHQAKEQRKKSLMIGLTFVIFGLPLLIGLRVFWRNKRLKRALVRREAELPLYASLSEETKRAYQATIRAPQLKRYPKDVAAWLQADFARYVREHFHQLVTEEAPQAPQPLFVYGMVAAEKLPQTAEQIWQSPDMSAYLALIDPQVQALVAPYATYLPAFGEWAKKVDLEHQLTVWRLFTAGLKKKGATAPKTVKAQKQIFKVLYAGIINRKLKKSDLAGVPNWVREEEERQRREALAATTSSPKEDTPFGGGQSGGGGFSGKW